MSPDPAAPQPRKVSFTEPAGHLLPHQGAQKDTRGGRPEPVSGKKAAIADRLCQVM
jgi:hypothetical protein